MSKKVLIISGSPRIGGNTDSLCMQFELGAKESGNIVEKVYLRKSEIGNCLGCGVCQGNGGTCIIKDDMNSILDKMMDVDVIVMATPVYYSAMYGKMKTLIDRTFPKFRELKNKEFYFISTALSSSEEVMQDVISGFRRFIFFLPGSVEKGSVLNGYAEGIESVKSHKTYQEAYEMGKNI